MLAWVKKWGHRLMTIILSNLNRFEKKITRKFLGKFVVKRIHCAAVAALRWKKRFLWCLTSAAQQRAAYVWTAPNTFVKLRRFLFCLSFSSFASQYCVSAVIKELVTTPDGQASLSGDVFSVTDISVLTELCWIALGRNAAYCCRCSTVSYTHLTLPTKRIV